MFGVININKEKIYCEENDVIKHFSSMGYIFNDVYIYKRDKVDCCDKEGYKYVTSYESMSENKKPLRFSPHNPYSMYNMKHLLEINKSDTKLISSEYKNSGTKYKFLCSCGNEFYMTQQQLLDGKLSCNNCTRHNHPQVRDYYNIIKDECNKYDYTLLTKNIRRSSDVFYYICNKHKDKGIQHSTYDSMICGKKHCKYCGIISRGIKHRCDENDYKTLAESKGFIYCGCEYKKNSKKSTYKAKLKLICKKHMDKGVQEIDYQNLKVNKVGCQYCAGRWVDCEELNKRIVENNLNIEIINFNSYTDVDVKCLVCGYTWNTKGVYISRGHSCPRCNKSNYERKVEKYLIDNNISYISQYKIKNCADINVLPFDFYLIDYNILIEVDGQGHYRPVNFGGMSDESAMKHFKRQIKHDIIKDNYCYNNNIKLIRIPYYVIDNNEVSEFMNNKIC